MTDNSNEFPGFTEPDAVSGNEEHPAERLTRVIGEAIGAASVCWSETPSGVFDSTRASNITSALIGEVELFLSDRDSDPQTVKDLEADGFIQGESVVLHNGPSETELRIIALENSIRWISSPECEGGSVFPFADRCLAYLKGEPFADEADA